MKELVKVVRFIGISFCLWYFKCYFGYVCLFLILNSFCYNVVKLN